MPPSSPGLDRDLLRLASVVVLGTIMSILDTTVVNVAIDQLAVAFRSTLTTIQWVITGYTLALAAVIPVTGWAADRFGTKRIYLWSLVLFTLGSVLSGLSWSAGSLIFFRVLQGIGGGMIMPAVMTIMTKKAGPQRMGRVMGVLGVPMLVAPILGPILGGWLVDNASWRWIFFINLPIGIATAIAARRMIEPDRGAGLRAGADVPGAVLVTGAMMLGVYTIVGPAAEQGWLAAETLGLGAATLALLAGFVLRQRTARHPLMPLRVFASRTVTGSNLVQVLGTAGMFGMFFLGSLYLREILHYDPLQIGLAFLPVAVIMGTLSVRYTDRLALRFGARPVMLTGLALIAAGLALFAVAPASGGSYLPHVFPVAVLIGTGSGLCFPALMTLAMSGATAEDAGLASGLVNTTGQIGGALGLAVLATVSAARTSALTASHQPAAIALTGGYHLAFWIACGLVVAAAGVTLALLRPQPAPAAEPAPAPVVRPAEDMHYASN